MKQQPEYNARQRAAFDDVMAGHHVLLTGMAGTGKSFLTDQMVEGLRALGKRVAICASTGISAVHIGGSTIHSFLGTRIFGNLEKLAEATRHHHINPHETYTVRRVCAANVLIIDEISMLSGDYIDMADWWLRRVRGHMDLPFGGLQLILIGDFLQLPPVQGWGEQFERTYAFQAKCWEKLNLKLHVLTKSYRQEDQEFVNHLMNIRRGSCPLHTQEYFKQCVGRNMKDPTRLFTHNEQASDFNRQKLDELPGDICGFEAAFTGKERFKEQLIKNCIAEPFLDLKVGAPVLFLKNRPDLGFINGTRGYILAIDHTGITAETDDGNVVDVEAETWELSDGLKVVATMTQYPLKLAWAITVHKSQGMSLDHVYYDFTRVFERGQTYVALSRARNVNGLELPMPLTSSYVEADQMIVNFYERLSV